MTDKKKPAAWAEAKQLDPATLAACSIRNRWDRDPALELDESTFDAAVQALEEIQVGGMHIEAPKTNTATPKKAPASEVK